MTGSADGNTITASMSGVPSIMNSLNSLASSKLSVHSRPKSPEAEEVIAELLEKAKFYTSLCLGKCDDSFNKIVLKKGIDQTTMKVPLFLPY